MTEKWRSLKDSPNYKNGKFQNLHDTPVMAEGASFRKIISASLHRPKSVKPSAPLPSVRSDLKKLSGESPTVVWFGHSSYLIHCKGINILIDPVFSGHASPFKSMVKAFPGANVYGVEDMPPIDILLLSHNHYDHLDKSTVAALKDKVKACYLPLGVGAFVAGLGIDKNIITEMDWWEGVQPLPGVILTATPARHFSGRGLKRAGSLWASFVLQLYGHTLYLGADSGYDTHFAAIGEKYGPFDLAILECGQYNQNWPFIHMMPEQTAQAAIDLKAKVLLPVHWAKFTLANHPWNEPIQRLSVAAAIKQVPLTSPLIGEPVTLGRPLPHENWWSW